MICLRCATLITTRGHGHTPNQPTRAHNIGYYCRY